VSKLRNDGNLLTLSGRGFFGQGDMQKEFEDAAFKLEPGQISGIVSTASGLHLIQRSDPTTLQYKLTDTDSSCVYRLE
jgi:parvulin-like peptidyl-prolyl isomerase